MTSNPAWKTSRLGKSDFITALVELASENKHPFPSSTEWERLFYSNTPKAITDEEKKDLGAIAVYAGNLLHQNYTLTWNFYYLSLYFISQLRRHRLKAYDGIWSHEALNSQYAIKMYLSLCSSLSREELMQIFELDREAQPQTIARRRSHVSGKILDIDPHVLADKRLRPVLLLDELIQAIIYGDTQHPTNYYFYSDSLSLLATMLSSQARHAEYNDCHDDLFLFLLTNQLGMYSNRFISRMLRNIVEQQKPPEQSSNGLFMSAYSYLFTETGCKETSIADKSIFLLVLVSNQTYLSKNPFATSLGLFTSLQEISPTLSSSIVEQEHSHISFKQLFDTLKDTFDHRQAPIALLSLLSHNSNFRIYFLSRTDPETMVHVI
jgi:hypothetical protein